MTAARIRDHVAMIQRAVTKYQVELGEINGNPRWTTELLIPSEK